jgi:hypothetical protein
MSTQGKAAKSASGAAMSKYDVEVEARLQALESHTHPDKGTGSSEVSGDLAEMIKEVYSWYLNARTKV